MDKNYLKILLTGFLDKTERRYFSEYLKTEYNKSNNKYSFFGHCKEVVNELKLEIDKDCTNIKEIPNWIEQTKRNAPISKKDLDRIKYYEELPLLNPNKYFITIDFAPLTDYELVGAISLMHIEEIEYGIISAEDEIKKQKQEDKISTTKETNQVTGTRKIIEKHYALLHYIKIKIGKEERQQRSKKDAFSFYKTHYGLKTKGETMYKLLNTDWGKNEITIAKTFKDGYKEIIKQITDDAEVLSYLKKFPHS